MATKAAIDFFFKNAGYSYDPKTETKAQGKRRGAKALAQAEEMAEDLGWKFEWEDDPQGWEDFDEEQREDLAEVVSVILRDENGGVVGSLGGIGLGKGDNSKFVRVIGAEVALQALHEKGLLK